MLLKKPNLFLEKLNKNFYEFITGIFSTNIICSGQKWEKQINLNKPTTIK